MSAITYRRATDADGPAIGKLFAACDYGDLGVDWQSAQVGAWWLVADRGGEIVGAIQFALTQPCGLIGDCVVHEDYRAVDGDPPGAGGAGLVMLLLFGHVFAAMRDAGVQAAVGYTAKPGMVKIIERYGGVSLGATELFAKGLA